MIIGDFHTFQVNNRQLASSERFRRQLDSLLQVQGSCPPTTTVSGPIKGGTAILHRAFSEVLELIEQSSLSTTNNRTRWVQAQLHGVLHDVLMGQIQDRDADLPVGQGSWNGFPQTYEGRKISSSLGLTLTDIASIELNGSDHNICFTSSTHKSQTSLQTTAPQSLFQCRLHVAPNASRIPTGGCVVQFVEMSGPPVQIYRSITGFQIHPRDSPIFDLIRNGDLQGVQDALLRKMVYPNDCDEDGNTLLSVSVWTYLGNSKRDAITSELIDPACGQGYRQPEDLRAPSQGRK